MPRITLPYPPSVNHYWRRVGPRTLISKQGRQYKIDVAAECLQRGLRPTDERVAVTIYAAPPDRRRRDLDNLLKPLLDSLAGYAYRDDSQIDRLEIVRCRSVADGSVDVIVEELGDAIEERTK